MTRTSLGVDVGGTFTDFVTWDGIEVRTGKRSTSPDQSEAVMAGAGDMGGGDLAVIVHGTTVATNALLERRGARTVLVADDGFTDVPEIGRQDRPSLYDSDADRPDPLVPAGRRVGVGDDPGEMIEAVAAAKPESVAVSLLYSYRDPEREEAVAAAISKRLPGVPVSVSSAVVGEFREFERASTTILNAYLRPEMDAYLRRLGDRATEAGVNAEISVMRSSGGLMSPPDAAALPVAALLSGPAGGVVAAARLGQALGHDRLISFDMGGTSTDVCRITAGEPEVSYERAIDGYPCRMPSVAVHTVGAGGGSVGWVDAGGALRVGPRSAGAHPGPAAYGRGGVEPAVTDANLALGRLAADAELADGLVLDSGLALAALSTVGDRLAMSAEQVALGMVAVVEEHMAAAIRHVTIEEGADPRDHVLVAFGGAGGLHASALAKALAMPAVVVPAHAGVFSALGLLLAPPRVDSARSVLLTSDDGLAAALAERAETARALLARSTGTEAVSVETLVDSRYVGQSHEVTVPLERGESWDSLAGRFHRLHAARNGFARPDDPIEVVTIRGVATGAPILEWDVLTPGGSSREASLPTRRRVLLPTGPTEAVVVPRRGLGVGDEIAGPAIVTEAEATTLLLPGDRARVDASGALVITW